MTHELAVISQGPRTIVAATMPGPGAPRLEPEQAYELRLAEQRGVTYAVQPAKASGREDAHGGLVRLHVTKPGLYRVSISSGHWVDVVDGTQLLKSRGFSASHGCERLHKSVEFELPAGDLTLQLSGATEGTVRIAVTAAAPPANR
jgi:hypothetical protein